MTPDLWFILQSTIRPYLYCSLEASLSIKAEPRSRDRGEERAERHPAFGTHKAEALWNAQAGSAATTSFPVVSGRRRGEGDVCGA